jgi:hypothetical protein
VTKHLYVRTVCTIKYGVTFFTISVLSDKISPPVPSAFGCLIYTDDRNYRPHLHLIYLWYILDDRVSVCPIYSSTYLWITDQCKYPKQTRKFKAGLCWIVGMDVQSHTFIIYDRFRLTHIIFFTLIGAVISDENLTVSLYSSWCGKDKVHIEGKVSTCTAVPIQINRILLSFQQK